MSLGWELLIRFLVGGAFVSAFSLLADIFKPKTFAGLFGAAPSVALASLLLTIATKGPHIAAIDAQAMTLGAVALLAYSALVATLSLRSRANTITVSLASLLAWFAVAAILWEVLL